jgi:hypothetical protein
VLGLEAGELLAGGGEVLGDFVGAGFVGQLAQLGLEVGDPARRCNDRAHPVVREA